jgi:hypothetical protein
VKGKGREGESERDDEKKYKGAGQPGREGRGKDQSSTVTSTATHPRATVSLIPGNHGRLLKIQLPPISHAPRFSTSSMFVQTYLLCRVFLVPTTTTVSHHMHFSHRRCSQRMVSSAGFLLESKSPRKQTASDQSLTRRNVTINRLRRFRASDVVFTGGNRG